MSVDACRIRFSRQRSESGMAVAASCSPVGVKYTTVPPFGKVRFHGSAFEVVDVHNRAFHLDRVSAYCLSVWVPLFICGRMTPRTDVVLLISDSVSFSAAMNVGADSPDVVTECVPLTVLLGRIPATT